MKSINLKKLTVAIMTCLTIAVGATLTTTSNGKTLSDAQSYTGGTPIDVYILAGQSNMAGTSCENLLPDKYKKRYDTVKMWYEIGGGNSSEFHKWTVVKPGQGAYINNKTYVGYGFGPELGMAEILHNKQTEIAFIKYAYGGTAIYQHGQLNNNPETGNFNNWHGAWDAATPGRLYNELFANIRSATNALKEQGYSPVIRGMAWMQGETDGEVQFNTGTYAAADEYEHNLTEFFNAVRAELDEPYLPIVFGEIYEYSRPVAQVRKIVNAQVNVGKLENNYFIDTGDLAIDGSVDDWHWNGMSEWLLGARFGEKLYEVNFGPFDNSYKGAGV